MSWICKECGEPIRARIEYDSINKDGSPSEYGIHEYVYFCWGCDGEWDAMMAEPKDFATWEEGE